MVMGLLILSRLDGVDNNVVNNVVTRKKDPCYRQNIYLGLEN